MRRLKLVGTALLPVLFAAACEQVMTPLAPRPVENPQLGIAFSDLPRECEVETNEGPDLVLACAVDQIPGTVTAEVVERARIDLRQSAREQRGRFEALPEGAYHGLVELVTPTGAAFTSRGRYLDDGAAREELQVFILHPSPPPRELVLRYVYPEGDRDHSQARRDQLLFLTGELEGLDKDEG
jgi:hypothetical protein